LGNDAALLGVGHLVEHSAGSGQPEVPAATNGQPRPHANFSRTADSHGRLQTEN